MSRTSSRDRVRALQVLLVLAGHLYLVGCLATEGNGSLEDWASSVLGEGDTVICMTSYDADYFLVVKDDIGIRLDQSIVVGFTGGQPAGYARSVSFQDVDGRYLGREGSINQRSRATVERGRLIIESRSEYFPVSMEGLELEDVVVTIRVSKDEKSSKIEYGSSVSDESFNYTIECRG